MPPETDNLRIEELHISDQRDREHVYATTEEVETLKTRDLNRRQEVLDLMSRGEVNTANDLYRASVIFHHGATADDFLISHRLALLSSIQGHRGSRWLSAASLDRFLMSIDRPQIYGTQFEHNREENRYQLRLPLDDKTLLHFEKNFLGVPAVMERLAALNRKVQNP